MGEKGVKIYSLALSFLLFVGLFQFAAKYYSASGLHYIDYSFPIIHVINPPLTEGKKYPAKVSCDARLYTQFIGKSVISLHDFIRDIGFSYQDRITKFKDISSLYPIYAVANSRGIITNIYCKEPNISQVANGK